VERRGLRITLIIITVLVVGAITTGAELLLRDVDPGWGLLPVLRLAATVIMVAFSGLCLGFLVDMIRKIWKEPEAPERADQLLAKLWHPARLVLTVAATGAVVAVGLGFRPVPERLEQGPLTIMTAFPADATDARSMLLDQWNRLNPNNHAEFEFAPLDADGQHERMVTDARRGDDQVADIYVLDIVWMEEFASRGYIKPLDRARLPTDMGDFVPKVLETGEFDENLWALPFNSDVGLIYRRTGIPGVHPPRSWDDYLGTTAKAMMSTIRASHPELQAANATQLAVNDEMLTVTAFEAIWGAGGRLVDPNGKLTLTPDGRKVAFSPADLMGIRKLAAAAGDRDITLAEAPLTTADAAVQQFVDGRTAYMRNWPVARDVIGDQVSYDVSALPEASVLGGQNLAIASRTDKPRAAQALIQFLTNSSSQLIISEVGGFVPTRQSAFNNSRRPDAVELQTALNQARLRPVAPDYLRCSQVFREGITRSFDLGGQLPAGFDEELARACT
jgi:multiple sugar transport system substrate-binding protein